MFSAWLDLPAWLRVIVGLLVLLAGGAWLAAGLTGHIIEGHRVIPRFIFLLISLGFFMMVFGVKTDSERNGYHF